MYNQPVMKRRSRNNLMGKERLKGGGSVQLHAHTFFHVCLYNAKCRSDPSSSLNKNVVQKCYCCWRVPKKEFLMGPHWGRRPVGRPFSPLLRCVALRATRKVRQSCVVGRSALGRATHSSSFSSDAILGVGASLSMASSSPSS